VNESGLAGERLRGPTGIIVAHDALAGAKVITDFAKANDQKPVVKGGMFDGKAINADQVKALASMPSREQMLSELGAGLMAPLAQFAGAMNGLMYMMVGALEALRAQKEGGEGSTPADAGAAA
jgi:large subunit ribosomal protein L10